MRTSDRSDTKVDLVRIPEAGGFKEGNHGDFRSVLLFCFRMSTSLRHNCALCTWKKGSDWGNLNCVVKFQLCARLFCEGQKIFQGLSEPEVYAMES